MMHVNKERTEIVDLDAETITVIDHVKKQYTTMTFEQMRQQMEAAMAKAKEEQAKQKQQPPPQSNDAQNVDVKFNVKVRNTGATKDVAGLNAKESIMTMTMDATDKTPRNRRGHSPSRMTCISRRSSGLSGGSRLL